jgi:hypothetical protein
MAKAPRIGHGKSRLAAGAGLVEALRINRAMQARALLAAGQIRGWRVVLAITPDRERLARRPGVWPTLVERQGQGGGDLGARLARAAAACAGRAFAVIGVDCPDADGRAIAAALARLRHAPCVIGPTTDGGFWILAARRAPEPRAFDGVRWSSAHARADMVDRLDMAIAAARTLSDIDTVEDWRAYQKAKGAWRPSKDW